MSQRPLPPEAPMPPGWESESFDGGEDSPPPRPSRHGSRRRSMYAEDQESEGHSRDDVEEDEFHSNRGSSRGRRDDDNHVAEFHYSRHTRTRAPPPPLRPRAAETHQVRLPTQGGGGEAGRQVIYDYDTGRYYDFPSDGWFDVRTGKIRRRLGLGDGGGGGRGGGQSSGGSTRVQEPRRECSSQYTTRESRDGETGHSTQEDLRAGSYRKRSVYSVDATYFRHQ